MSQTGWNLENTYLNLPEIFYDKVTPNQVSSPELVIFNESLSETIGLNEEYLSERDGIEIMSGNKLPPNAIPLAQSYAGHQFGHFTMLGDGRAMLLGEQITPEGSRLDIQLKGSGKTRFSRGGDGRATLGPMLREYIISEAMHGLNIPTSRSLAVVKTGEKVKRETMLEGAILTRVADSHLRVGTFQFAAKFGEVSDLTSLADYAVKRHYPDLSDQPNPYVAFLNNVIKRQAALLAQWQAVGFIHGVMNTDNMTISGETIDYGPCAFMDVYHQKTVFSSIDHAGRYAYMNQPGIAGWNLARFAESLLPLFHNEQEEAVRIAQEQIETFKSHFHHYWYAAMRAKLGLFHEQKEDAVLIEDLLRMMEQFEADYTNTFLALTFNETDDVAMAGKSEFKKWLARWKERLEKQAASLEEAKELMRNSNPAVIPRNYWVEEALEAAVSKDDFSQVKNLLHILKNPYAHTKQQKSFAKLKFKSNPAYQTYCGT